MTNFIQQVIFGLANGGLYALIAIGFALAYRTIRLLNFSHQQFVMLAGLVGYSCVTGASLPLWLAILIVPVAMALLSMLVEAVIIRPIRTHQGDPINMIIATLGVGVVMVEFARLVWGAAPLTYPSRAQGTVSVGGVIIADSTIIVLAVTAGVLIVLQLFLYRTWLGRALRATAEHWRAAELVGIPTNRMVSLTFAITGALAGLAGVLIAWLYLASFTQGDLGVEALSGAVLGGFGSLPGAVVGGLTLGVAENLFSVYAISKLSTLFVFALLIIVLLVRPKGLLGSGITEAR